MLTSYTAISRGLLRCPPTLSFVIKSVVCSGVWMVTSIVFVDTRDNASADGVATSSSLRLARVLERLAGRTLVRLPDLLCMARDANILLIVNTEA